MFVALLFRSYLLPYPVALWIQLLILFNNFIPISLYVVSEMISLFHAFVFNFDESMKSAETKIMPICRSTQLTQELGLIEFIFSDKTGTLTKNKMTFTACVAGDSVYYVNGTALFTESNGSRLASWSSLSSSSSSASKPSAPRQANRNKNSGPKSRTPASTPKSHHGSSANTNSTVSSMDRHEAPMRKLAARGFMMHSFTDVCEATRSQVQHGEGKVNDTSSPVDGLDSRPQKSPRVSDYQTKRLHELVIMMSVAHTVTIDKHMGGADADTPTTEQQRNDTAAAETNDGPIYQAESPDELALVKAAAEAGYQFENRSRTQISVRCTLDTSDGQAGTLLNFEMLANNAFTSSRKRQSMVLRRGDGSIWLVCKGADSAVVPRCNGTPQEVAKLNKQLRVFSMQGLRTLVYVGYVFRAFFVCLLVMALLSLLIFIDGSCCLIVRQLPPL